MNDPPPEFKLIQINRSQAVYTEGSRSIELEVELTGKPSLLIVYLSGATHWKDGALFTEEDRARVRQNLESSNIEPYSLHFDIA
jgi:hypothetical protein